MQHPAIHPAAFFDSGPKPTGFGLADPDALGSNQEWALGHDISLTTTLGEDIQGELFAFDKHLNCIVLKQDGTSPGQSNLRILKVNFIKVISSASPPKQPYNSSLPYIDPQYCKEREDRALQAAEGEASRIGVGVSTEGQQVFDVLSKTLPCRWAGKDIIVLDQVSVSEPYLPESCKAFPKGDQAREEAALQRVQKVVEAGRARA